MGVASHHSRGSNRSDTLTRRNSNGSIGSESSRSSLNGSLSNGQPDARSPPSYQNSFSCSNGTDHQVPKNAGTVMAQSQTSIQSNLSPNGATRISSSNRSNANQRRAPLIPITSRNDIVQAVGGDVQLNRQGSRSTRSKGSRSRRRRRSNVSQSNADRHTVSRSSSGSQKSNRSTSSRRYARSLDQGRPADVRMKQ